MMKMGWAKTIEREYFRWLESRSADQFCVAFIFLAIGAATIAIWGGLIATVISGWRLGASVMGISLIAAAILAVAAYLTYSDEE